MTKVDDINGELRDELPEVRVPPMSALLRDAIENAEPVKLRRPWRDLGVFLALSIPVMAIVAIMTGIRADLSELRPLWFAGVALVWLVSFGAASYLGFVPAKGHVSPRSRSIYEIVAAASAVVVAVGLFATQSASGSVTYPATFENVMAHATGCSVMGVGVGILPGLVTLLFMRRFIPVGRISIGLSLGAAGGSLAGLVLHLHCPVAERFHVGLVHGGCLVISALFVAGASQILLRDRSR